MIRGILYVESRPESPEKADAYHEWYEGTHVPEILALDGFVSARRFAGPEEGTFTAVYELDVDPAQAEQNLRAAGAAGKLGPPVAMSTDPAPVMRFMPLRFEQR